MLLTHELLGCLILPHRTYWSVCVSPRTWLSICICFSGSLLFWMLAKVLAACVFHAKPIKNYNLGGLHPLSVFTQVWSQHDPVFTIYFVDNLGGIDAISEIKQVIMKDYEEHVFSLIIYIYVFGWCFIWTDLLCVQCKLISSLGNRTHDHGIASAMLELQEYSLIQNK